MTTNPSHPPMRVGLLGERLSHSFSPRIHAALVGHRYTYALFERSREALESFIKGQDWDALNVTIPYKQAVMPFLDVISEEALRIGAVNTITRLPDGRLKGDNTDYFGFARTLSAFDCIPKGKKALVLGNGGAAATAVAVLTDLGAHVVVLGRSEHSVGGISPEPYTTAYESHTDAEIVVNCTPVGMYPKLIGQSPVELRRLNRVSAVFDMVYNPARTALLQEAAALGIPACNGLLMLVAQAKRAGELFLGEKISDQCIAPILEDITRETENVVLVGMPGSGKSTIGRALAEALDRPFLDTDAMVVEAAGCSIPEIFANQGEAYFRALETEAVRKAGMMSGAVIATGGGVVTRACNYPPLSQNGRIIFLKRSLHRLSKTGRPLSQTTSMEELYARRLPLYREFADLEIHNDGSKADTIEEILRALGYRA